MNSGAVTTFNPLGHVFDLLGGGPFFHDDDHWFVPVQKKSPGKTWWFAGAGNSGVMVAC